jgi:DNA-binding NarL/FixJ family response regulator
MKVIVVTPVQLLGDGLAAYLDGRQGISVSAVVADLAGLREALVRESVDSALVDVTHGVNLFEVRLIATQSPAVALVALGLNEQRHEVIQCGRAGFAGYVARDVSLERLCDSLREIVDGRLACSSEISGGLLRALFRADQGTHPPDLDLPLTRRESEVLELIGRGLTNKEIGSELSLSVATVKHHVHHILEKLKLPRRAQAMRKVQDAPWIARTSSVELGK